MSVVQADDDFGDHSEGVVLGFDVEAGDVVGEEDVVEL